jgi:hypothetical protein
LADLTGRSQSGRVPTMQAENQLVVRMMPRLGVSGLRRQPWRRETEVHNSAVASMRASARDTSGSSWKTGALAFSTANGFAAVRLVWASGRLMGFLVGARCLLL